MYRKKSPPVFSVNALEFLSKRMLGGYTETEGCGCSFLLASYRECRPPRHP